MFADEAQTINEQRQSSVAEIQRLARIKETFVLRKNYRNSRPIAEVARHFFCGSLEEIPELPDKKRTGPVPSVRRFETWQESAARIARWAINHEAETVGVFLPNVKLAKQFAAELKRRGAPHVQLYHRSSKKAPEIDFDVPGVLVTFLNNAKGLEFDAVFIAELQASQLPVHDPLTKNLLYVLASRARSNLEFHWSGEGRPDLLAMFPPDLVRS